MKDIFKLQKEPIKMSWKEQELEGANTVSSNVDKDDQIIHEEQANRPRKKGRKLPSKRTRRLPTTRHDDFLSVH